MRPVIALGLAALLLATLPPPAGAAPPQEQAWRVDLGAAANAGAALALGFDEAGSSGVVGTADRDPVNPGDSDFARVLFDQGNVSSETDSATQSGEGKGAVGLSGDGRFAVAAGNHTGGGLAGPNIQYYALPDMAAAWTQSKPEPVSAVAISRDGSVVAAGTRNTTSSTGKVYRFTGQGGQVWERPVNGCPSGGQGGSVLSMDMSRDGKWLVVGSTFGGASGPTGCVQLFDTASLNPVASYEVPLAGQGDVTAVDITANGQWYAAGAAGGRFFLFQNTPAGRSSPLQDQLVGLSPVLALRVAEDGSSVVVADASSVNRYAQTPGLLALDWSAPVSELRSLDATPDGDYIVAGASQLVAFHRSGNATLWAVDLPRALVRVAQPVPTDVRVLAASGAQVRGFRLHWAVQMSKGEPDTPAIQVTPGQARSFGLQLRNTGSALETFELSAAPQGFTVALQPPQAMLRPEEAANITLTLTPLPGVEAGLYRVEVGVRGARSGVESRVTINASVGALPRLGIALADPGLRDRAVFQGDEMAIVLQVQNSGNARLEVVYDLTQDPNVGALWEASLSRTTGIVEAGGVTTNTLQVSVPFDAANGTENFFNVTVRGEGAQASASLRLVVNPIFTGAFQVIPQSKVVAPGKSVTYQAIAANNGTLREQYRLVYCVALPDLIPCLGNATLGLGGWSVALDTSAFVLDHGQSKGFQMAVAAPRGAIPGVDKLVLQVEIIGTNPEHRFRDTKVVITSVEEETPPQKPPAFTPGFEAAIVVPAVLASALLARACRSRR